ncbi:MAG: LCP family protein, partial [Clostridia bacterium]|nr:LCP family protein [Clostridia bacterium]
MSKTSHENKSVAKIVLLVLLGVIVLVAAVSGFLLTHYAGLFGDLREEERGNAVVQSNEATASGEQIAAPTSIADDVFTILLIGVDSRQDTYTGRSDTQMMISINQKKKKLVIASLLRDSYVSIPGHGNNRINAAYAFGGTNLLTQTIKNNFGIPVDRVAVVNFRAVADFVDAVGGVDIDVSEEEIKHINSGASGYLSQ